MTLDKITHQELREHAERVWAHMTDDERAAYIRDANLIDQAEVGIYWARKDLGKIRARAARRKKKVGNE